MFNSYIQLELRRQNIWHTGHHKLMANFKSVAYVRKRCRSKYKWILIAGSPNGTSGVVEIIESINMYYTYGGILLMMNRPSIGCLLTLCSLSVSLCNRSGGISVNLPSYVISVDHVTDNVLSTQVSSACGIGLQSGIKIQMELCFSLSMCKQLSHIYQVYQKHLQQILDSKIALQIS